MKVVIDIETNGLENPTEIWVIVCKDIDTGVFSIFRNVTSNKEERDAFLAYAEKVQLWIGHNILGYDWPVLIRLLGDVLSNGIERCLDTLIISKMADYPRKAEGDEKRGHSIEAYGEEFSCHKGLFSDFSKYSQEMEDYCVRDVEICHKIYQKYLRYINNPAYSRAIRLEHEFQGIVNALHDNGFCFDGTRARTLLTKVERALQELDGPLAQAFPPKLKLIREIHPKVTKHGTLSKTDFRWITDGDLSVYNGGPFSRCAWVPFNPASHKQVIDILNGAGWDPLEKTETHKDTEREFNRAKYSRKPGNGIDLEDYRVKLIGLERYGWKINEVNLATLPASAPEPARLLAKRILLESRRRTLTEWLDLVKDDGRIHGRFNSIGAWTHRMNHQNPNTANIPTEAKLFGKEMRSLWVAPKDRLLVGVDAEGIQLRIFAHYINDPEFTDALVRGKKEDKSDPHSLNQRVLGAKTRGNAKNFIFAYLLGGGLGKLASLLGFTEDETRSALDCLVDRYTGLQTLKDTVIPSDAKRGWFEAIDGRPIRIPGEDIGTRRHLCMSGYLQSGEAIVVKGMAVKSRRLIEAVDPTCKIVNIVHDEKIDECVNDFKVALEIAKINAQCLKEVGEELKLNCPLAGSYWNDDAKDYTIGVNWYQTH